MTTHIWLRAETKPNEHRTVLPPQHARKLMDAGFQLTVEASSQSIFEPAEYEANGCQLVPQHSWQQNAPKNAIILGLKELETDSTPLKHRHIHFAHVYKDQSGWENVLRRFTEGSGLLYDLEFLVDESGRRVAAFGHWAGFAGAAVAAITYINQKIKKQPVLEAIQPRPDQQTLIREIETGLAPLTEKPTALVIGALGRCGRGAVEMFESIGVGVQKWDLEETSRGGPFAEILDADIFLNCVFIDTAIPPFVTAEMLEASGRQLSVICDVSCDPYGDYNPVPVYSKCTTFEEPVETLIEQPPLHLIAIDHLPSLLPRESSEDFCDQLMPFLLQLDNPDSGVWKRAENLFHDKTANLSAPS